MRVKLADGLESPPTQRFALDRSGRVCLVLTLILTLLARVLTLTLPLTLTLVVVALTLILHLILTLVLLILTLTLRLVLTLHTLTPLRWRVRVRVGVVVRVDVVVRVRVRVVVRVDVVGGYIVWLWVGCLSVRACLMHVVVRVRVSVRVKVILTLAHCLPLTLALLTCVLSLARRALSPCAPSRVDVEVQHEAADGVWHTRCHCHTPGQVCPGLLLSRVEHAVPPVHCPPGP